MDGTSLATVLDDRGVTDRDDRVVRVDLRSRAEGETPSRPTRVYVHVPTSSPPRVVGVERE
jgi:hypothetical protein